MYYTPKLCNFLKNFVLIYVRFSCFLFKDVDFPQVAVCALCTYAKKKKHKNESLFEINDLNKTCCADSLR